MPGFDVAPVAFFAFNRPEHTRRTLAALSANELAADTDLYIFCDGPRSPTDEEAVAEVREICRNASGFASLHLREQTVNQGLANSLITGISFMFEKHERVIVFEDDILASPRALRFLNTCLERYQAEPVVFSIAAWSPDPKKMGFPENYPWDVYFIPRFHCWGWASWKDRWQSIDWSLATAPAFFDNPYAIRAYCQGGMDVPLILRACLDKQIDSWAIRADFARFAHGRLALNPLRAYVENIGFDNSGTHCGESPQYAVDISLAPEISRFPEYVFVDEALGGRYRDFLSGNSPTATDVEKLRAYIAASDSLASLSFFLHEIHKEQITRHDAVADRINGFEMKYLQQVEALQQQVEALQQQVEALQQQIEALQQQIEALQQVGTLQKQQIETLRWNLRHPYHWFFRKLRSKICKADV